VRRDVGRGYFTREQAAERFGVVLDDDLGIDRGETAALRPAR